MADPQALVHEVERYSRLRQAGQLEQAELALRLCLASQEVKAGRRDFSLTVVLYELGACLLQAGKLEEAEVILKRNLTVAEAELGREHLALAAVLGQLGPCVRDLKRLEEAEGILRRCLSINEANLGPKDVQVAQTVYDLGVCASQARRSEEAESLLTRSFAIFMAKRSFLMAAQTLYAHGRCLRENWKLERQGEAEAKLRQSLKILQLTEGRDGLQVAHTLYELGQCLRETGRLQEARGMLTHCLAIYQANLGSEHEQTINTLFILGLCLRGAGRTEEAECMTRPCQPFCEAKRIREGRQTPDTLFMVGVCLRGKGDLEEAELVLKRCLRIVEDREGPRDGCVGPILYELGICLRDAGELEEAERMLRRCLSAFEAKFGPRHYQLAFPLKHLGLCLREAEQLEEAILMLRRSLAIGKATLGPPDFGFVTDIGRLLQKCVERARLKEEAERQDKLASSLAERAAAEITRFIRDNTESSARPSPDEPHDDGNSSESSTETPKIIVAFDIGPSRSGWAVSIKGMAEGATTIRVPDGNSQGELTETAVLLGTEDHDVLAFGQRARERYADSNTGSMLFRRFVTDLYDRFGSPERGDAVTYDEDGNALSLNLVLVAVLRYFKKGAIAHLSSVSDSAPVAKDITWVFTLRPTASFEDDLKCFLRAAFNEAGITESVDSPRLILCRQPDAAYLAVYSKDLPLGFRAVNTKTLVLDCGSTAVNVYAHEIVSISPLSLRELLPPTGGSWGSLRVDKELVTWLEGFLGGDSYESVQQTEAFYELMKSWEECKLKFGGKENERLQLDMAEVSAELDYDTRKIQELRQAHNSRLKGDPHLQVQGVKFKVHLPPALVSSFFAPAISSIAMCLGDLREKGSLIGVRHAFLVGGFSSSPLLQAMARTELEGNGCVMTVRQQPGVAIVHGAVLYASTPPSFDRMECSAIDKAADGRLDEDQRDLFNRFGVGKLRTPRQLNGKDKKSAVKWVLVEEETNSLRTSEQTLNVLGGIPDNTAVNILSIVGSARQGKSFLMNGLTGSDNVFPVSPEPTPCTSGADLSPVLMSLPDFERGDGRNTIGHPSGGPTIAFVDIEGQGEQSPEHDVRLATPFLLLSQVIIYNWQGLPNKDAILQKLKVLLKAAEKVEVHDEDDHPFGNLVLVFRDVNGKAAGIEALLLANEDTGKLAQRQPKFVADRNRIRQGLRDAFKSITVHTMPRPHQNIEDGAVPLSEVVPEFSASLDQLRGIISGHLSTPHTFGGRNTAGGERLHAVVGELCALVDSAEDICPARVLGGFDEARVAQAARHALDLFDQEIDHVFGAASVVSVSATDNATSGARRSAFDEFDEATKEVQDHIANTHRQELEKQMLLKANAVASNQKEKRHELDTRIHDLVCEHQARVVEEAKALRTPMDETSFDMEWNGLLSSQFGALEKRTAQMLADNGVVGDAELHGDLRWAISRTQFEALVKSTRDFVRELNAMAAAGKIDREARIKAEQRSQQLEQIRAGHPFFKHDDDDDDDDDDDEDDRNDHDDHDDDEEEESGSEDDSDKDENDY